MALLDFLFMRSKKGVRALSNFMGIKVEKIEEMVAEVRFADPERHRQFILGLNAWARDPEALKMAATTFFVYRTFLRNGHPKEFEWWYSEFRKRNIIPEHIRLRELETASVTLRNIGLGVESISKAQAFYSEMIKEIQEEKREETLEDGAIAEDHNADHSGLLRENVLEFALSFLRSQAVQFTRDNGSLPQRSKDNWSLGYIAGVLQGMLEKHSVYNGAVFWVLLGRLHEDLLGSRGAFNRQHRTNQLREKENADYHAGLSAALEDINECWPGGSPTRWSRHVAK